MKKSKLEPSDLTRHIGFWMRRVSNHVSHTFARRLKAHDVTVAEWVVLREMYAQRDNQTSPSHVAELTGLSRGAVSKLISRLLEKKLVTREESGHDRRYQDIELTPAGVELVPKLARLADENDEAFFSALSTAERAALTGVLKKLVEAHDIRSVPVE